MNLDPTLYPEHSEIRADLMLAMLDLLNVRFTIRDGRVFVNAPPGVLTPDVLVMMREMKPQLYAILTHPQNKLPTAFARLDELSTQCSCCDAEVEYYSDDGEAFCQAHWDELHGISLVKTVAINDLSMGIVGTDLSRPGPMSNPATGRDESVPTTDEHVTITTAHTFVHDVETLTAWVDVGTDLSRPLALDLETTGLNPREERVISITLGVPGRVTVLDMRPYDTLPASERAAWRTALARLLEHPRLCFVGHNLKFDWSFLAVHFDIHLAHVYDTMLAEQLLHSIGLHEAGPRMSLQATAARYGIAVTKEARAWYIHLDKRTAWHEPFPATQIAYMVQDVEVAYQVYQQQREQLIQQGLQAVAQLENDALPALAAMEVRGVLIDRASWQARLTEQQQQLFAHEQTIQHELHTQWRTRAAETMQQQTQAYQNYQAARTAEEQRLAQSYPTQQGKQTWEQYRAIGLHTWSKTHPDPGKPYSVPEKVNLASHTQLKTALHAIGLPVAGTDTASLEAYAVHSPLIAQLLTWKKLQKLCSAFGENVLALVGPDNRLHADFAQIGASSGRIICRTPNLQQMPAHSEQAAHIRRSFIAAPQHLLLKADLSNIELRILAEMSQDATMLRLFAEGRDLHAETARLLFNLPTETNPRTHLYKDQLSARDVAKTVNFGLLYGMGAQGLAERINTSVAEAQRIIRRYFDTYPAVASWLKHSTQQALKQGYSTTLAGRKRYYPCTALDASTHASLERQARNHPIQGTNADILKRAMFLLYATLPPEVHLILVVHDELVLECPAAQIADATLILQQSLIQACRAYLPTVAIPEPEVVVGAYWKKV